jgi:magnesium-transporting ATPase (P-type)
MQWYVGLTPSQILFSFGANQCSFNSTNATLTFNSTTIKSNTTAPNYFGICATQDQFNTGQTITFIAIVLCQFYILSTRTNYFSFFSTGPWLPESRNLYLFIGQAVTIAIMIIVVFLPPINDLFQTSPPPAQFFFMPLVCAAIIFTLDEIRKFFVRRKMFYFNKWAW